MVLNLGCVRYEAVAHKKGVTKMHPARILAELKVKGYIYKDVCKTCGVHPSSFYNTIHRRPFVSPKVERELSRILEIPMEELWPDRKVMVA